MKKTPIIPLLLLIVFCSCDQPTKSYMVTRSEIVYDQVYEKNKDKIDKISGQINGIAASKDFGLPPEVHDSFDENRVTKLLFELGITEQNNTVSLKITRKNTVLLWDQENKYLKTLGMDIKATRAKKDSTQNWILTQLYDRGRIQSDPEFERIWGRHKLKNPRSTRGAMNMTQLDSTRLAAKIQNIFDEMDSLKYVILIDDIVFVEPRVISKRRFNSGTIVTVSDLYDLYTGEFISRKFHISINDSRMSFKDFSNNQRVRSALQGNPNLKLLSNLIIARNKTILEDYEVEGAYEETAIGF